MWRALRKLSLTHWIFVGMGVGILVGWADNVPPDRDFAPVLKPLSTIFLRMIKSIVAPLIFGTLVMGIAGHGDDLKRIGRLAIKSLAYFWVMTTVALAIGLIAGNLVRPGVGVILPPPDPNAPAAAGRDDVRQLPRARRPRSFFDAAAKNEVLQVVFWSALFAIALTQVKGRPKEAILALRRRRGGGDVQVRRHHHALRADRHRRGDGGHGRAQRDRRGGEPGQAGAHAVRRAASSSCWWRWCRRRSSPGSRSAPSRAR